MEIWFIAAVAGAILGGISNFYFKVVASRGYNAEVFSLYSALASTLLTGVILFLTHESILHFNLFIVLMFVAGVLAAANNIMKVYALRYIDSTIYFPLFKLLAPGLAIVFGIVWFAETFTYIEWLGMLLGLAIPLLLITKDENGRQVNLKAGLILIVLTALISAVAAALNKTVIDAGINIIAGMFYNSIGAFLGTVLAIVFKQGLRSTVRHIQADSEIGIIMYSSLRAIFISLSFGLILYAYLKGGTLAVVQTIHSMYILIPIVLAIIFYKEHWNLQKAIAIVLSLAALALLG